MEKGELEFVMASVVLEKKKRLTFFQIILSSDSCSSTLPSVFLSFQVLSGVTYFFCRTKGTCKNLWLRADVLPGFRKCGTPNSKIIKGKRPVTHCLGSNLEEALLTFETNPSPFSFPPKKTNQKQIHSQNFSAFGQLHKEGQC